MKLARAVAAFLLLSFATIAIGFDNHGYPYTKFVGCTDEPCPSDKFGLCQNNCTSYVAYILNSQYGIEFHSKYGGAHWGNAEKWDEAAASVNGPNIPVDNHPLPGDVAYWNSGTYGHVAIVEKVHFDSNGNATSVDITEYNYVPSCNFNHRENISVNNPDGYIHILAFNEGVHSLYYLDCYEMSGLCNNQTAQEWRWIVERVEGYRCTTCGGDYQEIASAFYGSGFGSSESSGPMPVTGGTNSGSLPNLIPNNSDIENASRQKVTTLHINEAGNCRMQTKNIGSASAGAFQSRCYISDGYKIDNNPRDEGKEDTQGLGPGETHTEHEDFTAPEFPGVYNAVWCTDFAKQVTESNEGDNCHAEDVFTVWSSPDITVSSISFGGGQTSFKPNDAFSIDTVITNQGENFGKTIRIGYYLDGVQIGTDQIKRENLKGGVSKVETLGQAVAPGNPGTYTVMVCADIENRIQETNEANNCLSTSITVVSSSAPPDPSPKKTNPATLKLLFN